MPIYEYRCKKGHTFDVMQRISDDPVQTCQECGAPVQRVFHPVAVHFKGSGFYNTDYGTRKRSRELKESGDGGSSNGSTSETGKKSTESSGTDSGGTAKKPEKPSSSSSSSKAAAD